MVLPNLYKICRRKVLHRLKKETHTLTTVIKFARNLKKNILIKLGLKKIVILFIIFFSGKKNCNTTKMFLIIVWNIVKYR